MTESTVRTKVLFELKTVVSDPSLLTFSGTSLQSETAVCFQTNVGQDRYLVRMNPRNPSQRDQHKMAAELFAPHPKKNIIALKGGPSVQVYDFELSSRLKSFKMTENVEYMKWLDISTLALVTVNGVYHCTMDADSQPQLIFARLPQMASCKIINYRTDASKSWCLLLGNGTDAEGRMAGFLQTFSVAKNKSQFIGGMTGMFVSGQLDGRSQKSNIMCIVMNGNLLLSELDAEAPIKMVQEVRLPDPSDAPILMEYSDRFGFIFVISAQGVLLAYDVATAALVSMGKISSSIIFTAVSEETDHGIVALNQGGQLLSISINPNTIIPFIKNTIKNIPLAIRIASRASLSGTDDLFIEQFETAMMQQNFEEAAKVVASSPGGSLRTSANIERFKTAPAIPGRIPPIMQYLVVMLEHGKLNEKESLELVMPVMMQGKKEAVEKWIKEGKISASEELGNFLRQYDLTLALMIYLQSKSHEKVVQVYCELKDYEKVIQYSKSQTYKAPYLELFRGVCQIDPPGTSKFAEMLYNNEPEGPLVDIGEVMEVFFHFELMKELTAVMVNILTKNDPSQARLQTRYLEILLLKVPQVADVLFGKRMFTEYDRAYIAHSCEKAGLYHRALEHYDQLADILRCIVFTNKMTPDFVITYLHDVSQQQDTKIGYACLKQLAKNKANLNLVVEACKRCVDVLEPKEMITIMEQSGMVEGVFMFLQAKVTQIENKDIVFRFIQSAVKMGQIKDVERVVRESKFYDPKEVKDYLKEQKIDPQSLVIVCDRYGYVEELIKFLYQQNQHKAIERYATGFNTKATPMVVGALIDAEANEEFIDTILSQVKGDCPMAPLVEECEKRNRLRIIQRYLEARVTDDNNTDPACHSALAKIYVETNTNADAFLQDNQYYDSVVVGKYCEKRDPRRAVICYRRGKCDNEMLELTTKNSLYKEQAKYLVERKDPDLWARVLVEENPNRPQLIDQVIASAIPSSKEPDDVSATVKAFMKADLPKELILLLEAIMTRKSDFSNNKNLQNLLLITAIKADPTKVRDYIQRLDNYDGVEVAKYAIHSNLFEEAFEMYKKFSHHEDAMKVLLDQLNDEERANEYAVVVNTKECWSLLGIGQLDRDMTEKAIESFLKADDPAQYARVIESCKNGNLFVPLIKYLKMARPLKEMMIDSELAYAYAKTDALAELEEYVGLSNIADLETVGERCFDEQLYNAAKIVFTNLNNFARLASTLVCLNQFQQAVEAAKKAQSIRTWKEVCFACVDNLQFRHAQVCGVNIAMQADELEELVRYYTDRGHFDEIIGLMEFAIRLERTHMGMFTELGILYSKYKVEKLMEHIKLFHTKINIPQLLTVCERNLQWAEVCLLCTHYEEFDSAATKMLDHVDAWDHTQFKEIIQKVSNVEIYYKSLDIYLKQHPTLLCDLLSAITAKIDHPRVVAQMRRSSALALVKTYLLSTQQSAKPEIPEVNEAVNDLYLEEEAVDLLRGSIETYPTFDQLKLASRLEKHSLLRLRRLATWLYTRNKRFTHAVELAKKDKMYQDAMLATATSGDEQVAEELLRFVATEIDERDRAPCFAACLYTCYEILHPDVVLELAWVSDLKEYAMPYLINVTREYVTKVNKISADIAAMKEEKAQQKADEDMIKQTQDPGSAGQMGMMTPGMMTPGMMPPPMMMAAGMMYPPRPGVPPSPFYQGAGPPPNPMYPSGY